MSEKKTAKPKTNEVGGRPKKHVAPATTARKKEMERIANDNKHIARRLKSLKREPVSSFHAPNGNPSLKLKGQKVEADRPPEAWPIKLEAPSASQRKARNKQIASDNKVMLKQFNETLSLNKNSFIVSNKLGDGKDCRPMWEKRTSIYNPDSPLDLSLSVTEVPKSMAVVQCAGCSKRSYYGADGKKVFLCKCKQVYYCSDTCASIDWESHKVICNYHTEKKWKAFRPTEENWCQNKGMAEGRRLIRLKDELWPNGGATASIKRRVKEINDDEAAKIAVKAGIDKKANEGLEGPRPCCT